MAKFILGAAMALVLAGCGGGGSDSSTPTPPADPTHIVVIGNSISVHDVDPALGWDHVSGMAASSAATDYVHLVAAGLGIKTLSVSNYASLENNPGDTINHGVGAPTFAQQITTATTDIDAHTIVIVELGDNAQTGDAQFSTNYDNLLASTAPNKKLICLSTYWVDARKDQTLSDICKAHGGTYVAIGDIHTDQANRDLLDGPQFTDPALSRHPHDWSMAAIATRVLAALRS